MFAVLQEQPGDSATLTWLAGMHVVKAAAYIETKYTEKWLEIP